MCTGSVHCLERLSPKWPILYCVGWALNPAHLPNVCIACTQGYSTICLRTDEWTTFSRTSTMNDSPMLCMNCCPLMKFISTHKVSLLHYCFIDLSVHSLLYCMVDCCLWLLAVVDVTNGSPNTGLVHLSVANSETKPCRCRNIGSGVNVSWGNESLECNFG